MKTIRIWLSALLYRLSYWIDPRSAELPDDRVWWDDDEQIVDWEDDPKFALRIYDPEVDNT